MIYPSAYLRPQSDTIYNSWNKLMCKTLFQSKLFQTVHLYWKKYQANLLEKVKAISGSVILAEDGRHDSMGHSAKFGAYTIFYCTVPMILHFALIQVHVRSKINFFVQ